MAAGGRFHEQFCKQFLGEVEALLVEEKVSLVLRQRKQCEATRVWEVHADTEKVRNRALKRCAASDREVAEAEEKLDMAFQRIAMVFEQL